MRPLSAAWSWLKRRLFSSTVLNIRTGIVMSPNVMAPFQIDFTRVAPFSLWMIPAGPPPGPVGTAALGPVPARSAGNPPKACPTSPAVRTICAHADGQAGQRCATVDVGGGVEPRVRSLLRDV